MVLLTWYTLYHVFEAINTLMQKVTSGVLSSMNTVSSTLISGCDATAACNKMHTGKHSSATQSVLSLHVYQTEVMMCTCGHAGKDTGYQHVLFKGLPLTSCTEEVLYR